jgi:monovalent cation/hydrogen antiporter
MTQDAASDADGQRQAYRDVRRDVIAAQARRLAALHAEGKVSEATRRQIQRELDLEDARLAEDP